MKEGGVLLGLRSDAWGPEGAGGTPRRVPPPPHSTWRKCKTLFPALRTSLPAQSPPAPSPTPFGCSSADLHSFLTKRRFLLPFATISAAATRGTPSSGPTRPSFSPSGELISKKRSAGCSKPLPLPATPPL